MRMETLTYKEYESLKKAIRELGWAWQSYQQEVPDGWYEFKYQTIVRHFIQSEEEDKLFADVRHRRFPKRVKVPKMIYASMKELAEISIQLQDVLANPPYGSQIQSENVNKS